MIGSSSRSGWLRGPEVAQAARNSPGRLRLQRRQESPGFAGLGKHNRLAAMGGIDQARQVGFGLVNIDDPRLALQRPDRVPFHPIDTQSRLV